MGKRHSSYYPNELTFRLLAKLRAKTGKCNNDILNDAVWAYADLDNHIKRQMADVMAGRDETIRKIIKEELDRTLNCNRKREVPDKKNVE